MPKGKRVSEEAGASSQAMDVDDDEYQPSAAEAAADAAEGDAPVAKKQKKSKAKGPSRSGEEQQFENGVVRELVLTNFMNHKHLRVEFDPHVNFVVGKNGSGKSAIVNALIAGFGHRAAETGRKMNSSKSLIMHGQDTATIEIHLANGGDDPFKPDEFGDTIVAMHTLERNGAGAYKLKDGEGAYRRSSKSEFEQMCSHLNIQANNPCALLTQEHAKKFLHHGDAEARYRFFLQAANLDTRKADLNAAMQNVALLKHRLNRADEGMADKRELAAKAQAECDGAKKLKDLTQKLETFEPLLGWALVAEREQGLVEEEKRMEEAEEAEREAIRQAQRTEDEKNKLQRDIDEKQAKVAKLDEDMSRITAKNSQEADRYKKMNKAIKKAGTLLGQLAEELQEAEDGRAEAVEEHANLSATLSSTQDAAAAKRRKQREALLTKQREQQQEEKALDAEVKGIKDEFQVAVADRGRVEAAAKAAADELQSKEAELSETTKGAFNVLGNFHPQMPALVAAVEKNAAKFQQKPLGPLGSNVRVRKEHASLAPAAELKLGTDVLSFLVSSHDDEKMLRKVASQLKIPPSMPRGQKPLSDILRVYVRTLSDARFVVNGKRQSKGGSSSTDVKTLLDVLEITAPDTPVGQGGGGKGRQSSGGSGNATENTAWFNYLLDTKNADRVTIHNDAREAQEVVFASGGDAEGIFCITFGENGNKFYKRGHTSGTDHMNRQKRYLVESKDAVIKALQEEAKRLKQQSEAAKAEAEGARKATRTLEESEKRKRKELKAATDKLIRTTDELEALESASPEDEAERALFDVARKRDECAAKAEEVREKMAQEEESKGQMEGEIGPLKERLEKEQSKYQKLMDQAEKLNSEITDAQPSLIKAKSSRRTLAQEVEKAKKTQEEAKDKVSKLKIALEEYKPRVEQVFGERMIDPHKRSVTQLKQEKERLEMSIKAQSKKHGGKDYASLLEEARKAKEVVEANAQEMELVRAMGEKEELAFAERSRFFKKEAKTKGRNAGQDFNARLTKRGHAGDLKFDHDGEKLDLEISRNNQDTNAKATGDARALSGGERSFTTLSFELAMWEFCATPFRVLDEFDVYMDDTYRRVAVDTLLDLCDNQPQRQFLFLTPQDMFPFLQDRVASGKPMPRITRMNDVR